MGDPREILTESISTAELQRRWREVRAKMQAEKIDFLVMQNDNTWLGGYVKWFTDIPARNGYDLVERPAIRDDEPMTLQARMNITVHPIIGSDGIWVWVCDNYLVKESGVESLHKSPQEIFSI